MKKRNRSGSETAKRTFISIMLITMLCLSSAVYAFADDGAYQVDSSADEYMTLTANESGSPSELDISGNSESEEAETTDVSAETNDLEDAPASDTPDPAGTSAASESSDSSGSVCDTSDNGEKEYVTDDASSKNSEDIPSGTSNENTEEPSVEELITGGMGDGESTGKVVNDIAVTPSGTVRKITILNPEAGITSMQAAVWSDAGGQDDLKWIDMAKQADGNFSASASVGNLKHSGTCYVHVYSGSKFINGALFTVSSEEMAEFKLRVEGSGGSRTVILPMAPAGTGFKAALWSETGGQDDLKWHDMVQQSDGTWTVEVSVLDFLHNGKCIVHVYSGSQFIDGNIFEITAEELAAFKLTISGSGGKRIFTLPAGYPVTSLKAAVWSETGGQDDLQWIDMSKQSDGTWTAEISADTLLHAGTCIVHVYSGSRFIDGNIFNIKSDEIRTPELTISGENGTRTLLLTGGSSSYNNLRAAVWSASGGQDDIKWYDVTKQADGTWAASISAAYLKHGGTCHAHVYSGSTFIDGISFNMTAEEVNAYAFKISGTGGTRLLTVGGIYTGLPSLKAAVWSEKDGQGDLKWYNASRQADGTWLVDISVSVLLNGGTINVHGYSGNNFQFAMTFDLSDAEFAVAVQEKTHTYANSIISATGGTLRGAYNWAVNSIAYQSLAIPLTVPKTGRYAGFTRQELYLIYAFEQHLGDCFCYAASVFWCAKELGYTARLMEGMYNSASHGCPMPHGWVEIDMDGTTYFLDPEWEMQSRMNCYMVENDPLPLRRDLLAY